MKFNLPQTAHDVPNESPIVLDLHSKYGIVNICLYDIKGDAYLAYSCSEIPLECYNGMRRLRGKSAVRYLKLGELVPDGE